MIPNAEAPTLRAAIRAENDQPGFAKHAADVILRELGKLGEAPGEMLVDLAKLRGCVPADSRSFGPVFASLSKRGAIRQVGWTVRTKGHQSPGGRVWALA